MSKLTNGKSPFEPVPHGTPRPFEVKFGKENIEELLAKLDIIRWGPQEELLPHDNPEEDNGLLPTQAMLKSYVKQWKAFDFAKEEQKLNAKNDHFLVDIDWCKPLHFIHRRSSRKDAVPIILIHGWPGSFVEFRHVIDGLTEPTSDDQQAFHVVVPSLPGYAWSRGPSTKEKGIGDADGYCRILDTLMTSVLGYSSYAAQGGDWGSIHARCLGAKFARPDGKTGCRAVHLNFSPIVPQYVWALAALPNWLTDPALPYIPGEYGVNTRKMDLYQKNMAYYIVQQSKPQQLAAGLIDSPLGLLAWLSWFWALRLGASPTMDVETMLAICTIYFSTRSIGTSFLPYHNNDFFSSIHGGRDYNVKNANLGYTDYPDELINTTYGRLRSTGNLRYYAKAADGGHFAALEQPQIFVNHLRLAFAKPQHSKALQKNAEQLKAQGILAPRISGSLWSDAFNRTNTEQSRL